MRCSKRFGFVVHLICTFSIFFSCWLCSKLSETHGIKFQKDQTFANHCLLLTLTFYLRQIFLRGWKTTQFKTLLWEKDRHVNVLFWFQAKGNDQNTVTDKTSRLKVKSILKQSKVRLSCRRFRSRLLRLENEGGICFYQTLNIKLCTSLQNITPRVCAWNDSQLLPHQVLAQHL